MLQFILLLVFVALAVALVWFLVSRDHGEKEPVIALWMAVGFGLIGGVLAAWLEAHLLSRSSLMPGAPLGAMFTSALAVGVIEESCKFLPLSLVLYKKRYFNEMTDGVIYFALAGLGFGLPENILYTLQFGTHTGLMRALLTPLFHAGATALVGYFLIKQKLAHKSPFMVAIPLGAMMLLHGLYDFGLLSQVPLYTVISLLITLGVSAALFLLFFRASEHDREAGRSYVGHNSFCRSCGFPNPKHHLYCIHCGQHA